MTEPRELTYLVPVDVRAEVNTAVAVLEIQGAAVTEALRQLDRATMVAWKAVNMVDVTDEEWQLVKRAIGIERGWDAAYRLVSTLDLPGMPANGTPAGP
jgi:Mn-dependent DtxR family transcriptional regulator